MWIQVFENTIESLKQVEVKSIEREWKEDRGLNARARNLVWWGTPLVVAFAGYEVKSYRPQPREVRAQWRARATYTIYYILYSQENQKKVIRKICHFFHPNYKELETSIVFSYSIKFLLWLLLIDSCSLFLHLFPMYNI